MATAVVLSGCSSGGDAAPDSAQPSRDAKQKPVKVTVGFQPVFIPVKVTVNSEGDVDFSLAASWATPVGTLDLDVAKNDAPPPPAVHRLSVSYRKDGRKLVDRFDIRCARAYRVFMNGKFQAKVSTAETVIEITPNDAPSLPGPALAQDLRGLAAASRRGLSP